MPDKKKRNKKPWIIPAAAAGIAAVTIFAVSAQKLMENRELQTAVQEDAQGENTDVQNQDMQEETGDTQKIPVSGQVSWNGKQYVYNDHLSNFLFLGVDKKEKAETSKGQADAGQSDVIFLLSWDRAEHAISLISIPRDTMTEIEAFDPSGKSLGKSKDHLSLAYAYGDGGNESCELAKKAVSNLFYGLPVQGYCSVNMDGIPVMTEDIGGLTVTVPDDSLEKVHPEFKADTEVSLNKENTETFVRYRDTAESQSAIKRMKRQSVFMDAYVAKAGEEFKRNPGFITTLYEDLKPYMVTNIGVDQFAKIMKDAAGGSRLTKWTVPGEGTEGVSFDEYHVDDDKLYEMILETFYKEI